MADLSQAITTSTISLALVTRSILMFPIRMTVWPVPLRLLSWTAAVQFPDQALIIEYLIWRHPGWAPALSQMLALRSA